MVFVPSVEEVYPEGRKPVVPPLPSAATEPGLEDALRPGHFAGVCQVVRWLFGAVKPGAAIFGEKDYQQLAVIRAMTREQRLPIVIVPGETIREADGLAMSSRNRFLTAEERPRAVAVSRALRMGQHAGTPNAAERVMREVLESAGLEVQYAVVRDAETLGGVDASRPMRALIAARLGSIRLIDNAAWGGATRNPSQSAHL